MFPVSLQCIARAQNCLTSMFVKGGQISERGAKFPKGGPNFLGNMAPGGGGIFPRKFGPGGPYFGGAKFPGTPATIFPGREPTHILIHPAYICASSKNIAKDFPCDRQYLTEGFSSFVKI